MFCKYIAGTGPLASGPFNNWAQNLPNQQPQRIYQPDTIDQLVNIVQEAEKNHILVRAVGSGWSFTDIMDTPGYMVNTDNLDTLLSETITGTSYAADPVFASLTPLARQRKLVHVEAGIKIHNLHDWLETSFPAAQGGVSFNNPNRGGVMLPDGPGGAMKPHGWALRTLGGSGGQSIAGAVSTSTHGGDIIFPPLPDMVQAIHLVAAGGAEFFIQRGGIKAIVDTHLLGELRPCVAAPGQIISDDEAFNAAVVAMGRMGIIYSVVLEVVPQYFLSETIYQSNWNAVSAAVPPGAGRLAPETLGVIDSMRASNRFLQVLVLPYANSDGNRTCCVTMRNEVKPAGPVDATGANLFNFVCDQNPSTVAALVAATILAVTAAAAVRRSSRRGRRIGGRRSAIVDSRHWPNPGRRRRGRGGCLRGYRCHCGSRAGCAANSADKPDCHNWANACRRHEYRVGPGTSRTGWPIDQCRPKQRPVPRATYKHQLQNHGHL